MRNAMGNFSLNCHEREILGYCLYDAEDDNETSLDIQYRFLRRLRGECHPRMDIGEWRRMLSEVQVIIESGEFAELIDSLRRDRESASVTLMR